MSWNPITGNNSIYLYIRLFKLWYIHWFLNSFAEKSIQFRGQIGTSSDKSRHDFIHSSEPCRIFHYYSYFGYCARWLPVPWRDKIELKRWKNYASLTLNLKLLRLDSLVYWPLHCIVTNLLSFLSSTHSIKSEKKKKKIYLVENCVLYLLSIEFRLNRMSFVK